MDSLSPSLRTRWWLPFLLLAALLNACSSTPPAAATYVVKRGDTLYSIAGKYRLSYQELARWNGIGRNYLIRPGQVLRLQSGARPTRVAAARASVTGKPSSNKPSMKSLPRPAAKVAKPALPTRSVGPPVRWQWPVEGGSAVLTSRPNGGQGLTINGQLGQTVRSAGVGRVVYTGAGLLGYGQLVIIKHSESYLSAYGHIQAVMVREGDAVNAGQPVATMGKGPQGAPMLYFEIRINGAPGNPLSLLPQRN